jgi:hypothetical protein
MSLALVAALCAAVLAACGGGDDSTSSTPTDTTTAGTTVEGGGGSTGQAGDDGKGGSQKGTADGGDDGNGDGSGGSGSSGGDDGNGDDGSSSGDAGKGKGGKGDVGSTKPTFSGPPTRHEHPEPVDGARSEGFRVPGGDNSIQDYGEEQDSDERAAATKPIAALYAALEGGDWGEVCGTYLSANNLAQIKLLAEKSPKIKGQSCAEVLNGLNAGIGMRGPDTPDGEIIAFRVEGDTGFAIWWGIDGKGYAMPLKSEGGAWKLTALAPTPLQI